MFRVPVMSAMRMLVLAGAMVLAGCASWKHDESLPPDVGIRIVDADPATLGGTVVVTNHSRKRILILSNRLAFSPEPVITYAPWPHYDPGEGFISLSHDVRLAPGESLEYMKVRDIDKARNDFPAIYTCWDNRDWSCEQYWLVPSRQSWDDLIRAGLRDGG
jgi:hypothetical protein